MKLSDKYKKSEGNNSNSGGGQVSAQPAPTLQQPFPQQQSVQRQNTDLSQNELYRLSSRNMSNQAPVGMDAPTGLRQPNITIVCGATGMGKSWNLIQEIKAIVSTGRPVFLLETNGEPEYKQAFPKAITPSQVKQIINPECVRVLPINADGRAMNAEEIRGLCIELCMNNFNCGVVLDDYDKYGRGSSKTRDMSAIFMSNRHRGQDLLVIHQSLRAISSIEFQNAWMMRLHKTVDSVDIIADRLPNFSLVKIAELVISEQFMLAEWAWEKKKISEMQWKKARGFFLYVDLRRDKIVGKFSRECWIRNCKKFLRINPKWIKDYVNMYLDGDDSRMEKEFIMEKIIEKEFSRYYTPPSPL